MSGIDDKIQTFMDDMDIVHEVVHGDENSSATTQRGTIPSLAKAIAATNITLTNAANAAIAAKTAAEAARDATNTTGKVYSDTTTGLAGTTANQSFAVLSTDLQSWIVYKNNAGAALEIGRSYTTAYLDSLIRPGTVDTSGAYQRWGDSGGYVIAVLDALGLHHDQWSVGAAGLETPGFILKQEATVTPVLRLMDENGYGGLELNSIASDLSTFISNTAITLAPFTIQDSPAGTSFAVTDGSGYFSVHIPSGKSVGDTSSILTDLETIKSGSGITLSAPIPTSRQKIAAHRGSTINSMALEDSLDAYVYAARAGYQMVETDVQKTLDGKFVMMHDESVNRTMKVKADYSVIPTTVNIYQTNFATLRANYVLAAINPRHRRPIPTLDEFCATCRDYGVYPIIELKDWRLTQADITSIFNIAAKYLTEEGFAFTSFQIGMLDFARTLSTKVELYYIYDIAGTVFNTAAIDHVKANDGIAYPAYASWTDDLIAYAKSLKVPVACWTVPTNQFDILRKRGIEIFVTDTIAPPLDRQKVIFRDYSELTFSAYSTTGTISNGIVTLTQGQTLTFTKGNQTGVKFGANYFSFDAKGAASVVATRCSATVSNTEDDFQTYAYQNLMSNESFSLVITAGVGGCTIKDIATAIASFD